MFNKIFELAEILQKSIVRSNRLIEPVVALQKSIERSTRLIEPVVALQKSVERSTRFIEPAVALQKSMERSVGITHFIDSFSRMADAIKIFNERYDSILPYFQKYYWVISPNTAISTIKRLDKMRNDKRLPKKEFDRIMIDSFERNNFLLIREVIKCIEGSPRYPKRKKAILDCLSSIQVLEENSINIAHALLPSLIIQFDGMLTDYAKGHKLSYAQRRNYKNPKGNDRINAILIELNKKNTKPEHQIVIKSIDRLLFEFSDSKGRKPFMKSFNRHNIIHGMVAKFGYKQHIYRIVAIIDAFYSLK